MRLSLLSGAKFHFAYAFTSTIESLYPTVQISNYYVVRAVREGYGGHGRRDADHARFPAKDRQAALR